MKSLHVQIQPARSPGWDAEPAVSRLQALGESRVRRGDEGGPYINVDLRSADVRGLWSAVRAVIRADSALAACSMVCCEGEYGWDDYLLLHHFDATEPLDELE
jgi:hypothetical protein